MIQTRRSSPRAEYRLMQTERINAAESLAAKFPRLKSMTVSLEYFDAAGLTRNGGMKFKPNLEKAKAIVWFNCPNGECAGGDFDLSKELSRAISAKRPVLEGEMRCQGVRHNREKKEKTPCRNLLKYHFRLAYT
jgi:hypothetical protein